MVKFGWWVSFLVKLRMMFALPWERVKKGSVLSIKLKGEVLILIHLLEFE
jgi:protease-4